MLDKAYALYQTVCHEPANVLLRRFTRTLIADTGSGPGNSRREKEHRYPQDAGEDYAWYQAYLEDFKQNRRGTDRTISHQKMRENASRVARNLPRQKPASPMD